MPPPDHVRLPPSRCPHCGQRLDAVSVITGPVPKPEPWDVTVCIGCGEVAQFDRRLRLVKIRASDLAALAPEVKDTLRKTQESIRSLLATYAR